MSLVAALEARLGPLPGGLRDVALLDRGHDVVVELVLGDDHPPELRAMIPVRNAGTIDAILEHRGGKHAPALRRFVDACTPRLLDLGVQLAPDPGRWRLLARVDAPAAAVEAALGAAGLPADHRLVGNALALFGLRQVMIIGVELDGEAMRGAITLSIFCRDREASARLVDCVRFLLDAVLPGTAATWLRVAPRLLSPGKEEWVDLSFEPIALPPSVEIVVGARPLPLVERVAAAAGVPPPFETIAHAARLRLDPLGRLGLQLAPAPKLSLHGRLA
jgi:hypothetical protein